MNKNLTFGKNLDSSLCSELRYNDLLNISFLSLIINYILLFIN